MFKGCGTALVTPFQGDFSLDETALRRLVRRQVEAGVHFLVPCGTTGESPTLTHEERRRVVEITRSEEHTSELQSHSDLVCRLLLEKRKHTLNSSHTVISYAVICLKTKKDRAYAAR